ncbi:MAG TPA: BON domain-containing protein [Woeseiaceae bacterium]
MPEKRVANAPNAERLLGDVNAALEAETRVDIEQLSIELNPENGVLSIDGHVDDIVSKRIAANIARRVAGDRVPVEDRVRVRAPRSGDLELRDEVVKSLTAENVFSNHALIVEAGSHRQQVQAGAPGNGHLEVRVDAGVVTLEGTVRSLSHRRLAEVLMWWSGCERVDNRLDVEPPEEDTDDEITDIVRMVLEKDPLVHAAQLRVGTAAAVVEIRGFVASDEEQRLAVLDAWYVPGVWEVVDHIKVHV